jgi:hypothetical protein
MNGQTYKVVTEALLAAFPSRSALSRALLFGCELRLNEIAGDGIPLPAVVGELLTYMNSQGVAATVLKGLLSQNPLNPKLQSAVALVTGSPIEVTTPTQESTPTVSNANQKIHSVHRMGLLAVLCLALKAPSEEVEGFLDELIEEDTTYKGLADIDRDTISDAARATIKGVKAIQINNAVKVLQLFGPEIKVSEKGRLNIVKNELTGEWEVSSRTTDAEDGTLYKPVEFPKPIVGWYDGKTYPMGALVDDNDLPLTSEGIESLLQRNYQMGAHPWWSRNLGNFSVVDLCRALKGGKQPVQIFKILIDPLSNFCLREQDCQIFIEKMKTAVPKNTDATSTTQSFEWTRERKIALRKALAKLFPSSSKLRTLASDSALNTSRVDFNGAEENIAFSIIQEAEAAQKLDRLYAVALSEWPNSTILRDVRLA